MEEQAAKILSSVIGEKDFLYLQESNWTEIKLEKNEDNEDIVKVYFKTKDWDKSTIIIFEFEYNTNTQVFEHDSYVKLHKFKTWKGFKKYIMKIDFTKGSVSLLYN